MKPKSINGGINIICSLLEHKSLWLYRNRMLTESNKNELLHVNIVGRISWFNCYRGYRKDYLVRNLTELEDNYVVCPKCEGIMREAVDYSSIITCKFCSKSEKAKPIQKVRDSISKLEVRCPIQRDCGWKGLLSQAEQHLGTCECFLIKCPLNCKKVLMRSEVLNHTETLCPMREVLCEHCLRTGKVKDLEEHWKECHKYPILCDCEAKIPREEIEEHNKECPHFKLPCPFGELRGDTSLKCGNHTIHRGDLPEHKKAEHVVHLDMLHEKVLMLENRLFELELKLRCQKTLEGCEWELKRPFNNREIRESPEFYVHGYKLVIIARICPMSECLDSTYPKFTIFSLKRLRGDNDKFGVTDTITECRMVQINKDNPRKSKFQTIPLDYKPDTETGSVLFGSTYILNSDNNPLFRFYFDINNTRLEDMKTCYEKEVKPIPTTF